MVVVLLLQLNPHRITWIYMWTRKHALPSVRDFSIRGDILEVFFQFQIECFLLTPACMMFLYLSVGYVVHSKALWVILILFVFSLDGPTVVTSITTTRSLNVNTSSTHSRSLSTAASSSSSTYRLPLSLSTQLSQHHVPSDYLNIFVSGFASLLRFRKAIWPTIWLYYVYRGPYCLSQ